MRRTEVIAINPVVMEAHPDRAERLAWFYVHMVGLRARTPSHGHDDTFEFDADLGQLRIHLKPDARTSPNARKALVAVPNLPAVAARLSKSHLPFNTIRDFCFTGRKLSLLDPGGNRLELQQHWPPLTF